MYKSAQKQNFLKTEMETNRIKTENSLLSNDLKIYTLVKLSDK